MSIRNLTVLAVALAIAATALIVAQTANAASGTSATSYIVVYKQTVGSSQAAQSVTQTLTKVTGVHPQFQYSHGLMGFSAQLNQRQLQTVKANPQVASVMPNVAIHATSLTPLVSGGLIPTGVERIDDAQSDEVQQASSVSVAELDTGIDLTNPKVNSVPGTNCIDPGTSPQDDNGHGTHVAGIIGAENDGTGVVGVAPGTRIYAVKVLNSQGMGNLAQLLCGINWVTAHAKTDNIKVANMSLAVSVSASRGVSLNDGDCGYRIGDPLHEAICASTNAGVTYVVAAGNASANSNIGTNFDHNLPAVYPQVLTVTAMANFNGLPGRGGTENACDGGGYETENTAASFSDYPGNATDAAHTVAAPGVCITSTWLNGEYATISGTSMATPHATGVIAECFGEAGGSGPCAGLNPAQIIKKIVADARNRAASDPGWEYAGYRQYGPLLWAGSISAPYRASKFSHSKRRQVCRAVKVRVRTAHGTRSRTQRLCKLVTKKNTRTHRRR